MKLEAEGVLIVVVGAILGTVLYGLLGPTIIDPIKKAISGQ